MICCKAVLWQTGKKLKFWSSLSSWPWKDVYEWTHSHVLPENCAMWEYYHSWDIFPRHMSSGLWNAFWIQKNHRPRRQERQEGRGILRCQESFGFMRNWGGEGHMSAHVNILWPSQQLLLENPGRNQGLSLHVSQPCKMTLSPDLPGWFLRVWVRREGTRNAEQSRSLTSWCMGNRKTGPKDPAWPPEQVQGCKPRPCSSSMDSVHFDVLLWLFWGSLHF